MAGEADAVLSASALSCSSTRHHIPDDASQAYGLSAAPATLDAVDSEVRRIVAECYDKTVRTLIENRERLDALASALMENESLDEAHAYRVAGVPRRVRDAD